jgi:hypothetical protein
LTFGITKYRIQGTVIKTTWIKPPVQKGDWHPLSSLQQLALPVPVRKMIGI